MHLFDREALLADQTHRMRQFMLGVYSADKIESARKTGIECDACAVEVTAGRNIFRIGIYFACGPCAIETAERIKQLTRLAETE